MFIATYMAGTSCWQQGLFLITGNKFKFCYYSLSTSENHCMRMEH